MTYVLDTNVLLRYLVGDNPKQQKQAHAWFKQAEAGKIRLLLKPVVIAETSFVLGFAYKKSREEIAEALESMLAQKWLEVENRNTLTNMWYWYKKGFHFVDSYLLAWTKNNETSLLTFDKALEKAANN